MKASAIVRHEKRSGRGKLLTVMLAWGIIATASSMQNWVSLFIAHGLSVFYSHGWIIINDILSIFLFVGILQWQLKAAYTYLLALVIKNIVGIFTYPDFQTTFIMAPAVFMYFFLWLFAITRKRDLFS
jgi:hypothetical protein